MSPEAQYQIPEGQQPVELLAATDQPVTTGVLHAFPTAEGALLIPEASTEEAGQPSLEQILEWTVLGTQELATRIGIECCLRQADETGQITLKVAPADNAEALYRDRILVEARALRKSLLRSLGAVLTVGSAGVVLDMVAPVPSPSVLPSPLGLGVVGATATVLWKHLQTIRTLSRTLKGIESGEVAINLDFDTALAGIAQAITEADTQKALQELDDYDGETNQRFTLAMLNTARAVLAMAADQPPTVMKRFQSALMSQARSIMKRFELMSELQALNRTDSPASHV